MTRRFEPVSVVGISFRVPGASDVSQLLSLLESDASVVRAMPASRYAADPADYERLRATERPGTFLGAFLDDIERFDAKHFGVSPLEARRMDPQQRLSMEEAWRSLEDAGFDPRALAGSRTGVFIGSSNHDYVLSMTHDLHAADVFKVMGNALGMMANRVSHALDLRGPSFTVDTACSSSFVALHQALQSLGSGESDLALVGGVNLITSPHLSVAFSRARMLSEDGRCKPFSDDADGYGRGEAVVFLTLMRSEQARREGRRVYCEVLGSAVNQDGQTPVVTAPKREAQVAVITEALANAGVRPSEVSYVEAHGTGTPTGDPVELEALAEVFGTRSSPCFVNSIKARLGHSEPASGLVGLLHVIASMQARTLAPHRTLRRVTPRWTSSALELVTASQKWSSEGPRLAGVSSFGFGGTNVHVVVREAPEPPRDFRAPTLTRFAGAKHWKKPAKGAPAAEPTQRRPHEVLDELKTLLAGFLNLPVERVDADQPLLELGVDSLELFTLLQRVESRYGVAVPLDRVLEPRFNLTRFAEVVASAKALPAPKPSAPVGAFSMFAPRPPDEREAEAPNALERETIELVNARAPGSKQHTQRYRDVLADNRNAAGFRPRTKELTFPLVADRASGATLTDVDGREWIDFTLGFGVHLFGHAPQFIQRAVLDALLKGAPVGPQSPLAGEVAEQLARLTGLERFTFTNSGTEAVMLACRLARAATKRDRVVIFEGAYHGTFDGLLGRMEGGPLTPGTTPSMVADLVVLKWNDPSALDFLSREGQSIAAVLVEPVQSRRPGVQPVEFLSALREVTRAQGAALVFDEVITGFRAAVGGAQQRFGVKADLAVYGKVLGGGFPMGVVGGSARFLAGVDGGTWRYGDASAPSHSLVFFAGTFCKHPVAMAAARAVLERMESEGDALLRSLEARTSALVSGLNARLRDEGVPLEVVQFASLFRFHSAKNLDLFFARLNAAGFYVWEGRNCFVSTEHTEAQLSAFADEVVRSARAVLGVEELPVSGPQRRFLELPEESRAGEVSFGLVLNGLRDARSFESAVQRVLERHDVLRVRFDRQRMTMRFGGELRVDMNLFPSPLAGERVRERGYRLEAQRSERDAEAFASSPQPSPPPEERGSSSFDFTITAPGEILDATSLSILLKELALTLAGQPLPPAPSYREALTALANIPSTALPFWLEHYPRGLPPPLFPEARTSRARRLKHVISPADTKRIRELARHATVTTFTWLFTAFSRALTTTHDCSLMVPIADRRFPRGDAIVGNCTQLVAIPQAPLPDWTTHLTHNAALLPRCYEHARASVKMVRDALTQRGLPAAAPQVLFNLEPALRLPALTLADGTRITLEELDVPRPEARYTVSVNILESDDGLRIDLDFLEDALDEATARGLLERLVKEAQR